MNTRIGFLHIPKSAGAALNESIFTALGLRPFHVSSVVPRGCEPNPENPHTSIVEGSLAFKFACNTPYLPGHITVSDLRRLDRNYLFTALRDPRKRLISFFTYTLKRANSERVTRKFPGLKRYATMGFYEFIAERQPANQMMSMLLRDVAEYEQAAQQGNSAAPDHGLITIIEGGLRRLDVIYACSNQEILDDLHRRGLIPQAKEVRKNISESSVEFGHLGSRQEFLQRLEVITWQDALIYKVAQRLFPETVKTPLASDDDMLMEVERRFGARFTD